MIVIFRAAEIYCARNHIGKMHITGVISHKKVAEKGRLHKSKNHHGKTVARFSHLLACQEKETMQKTRQKGQNNHNYISLLQLMRMASLDVKICFKNMALYLVLSFTLFIV